MGGRWWTPDEDDCLRSGAARVAGRTPVACSARRFKLGLTHTARIAEFARPVLPYTESEGLAAAREMVEILESTVHRDIAAARRERVA